MNAIAAARQQDALPLPESWAAVPERLRKPYWTVNETIEATPLSRAGIFRLWADPRSGFPKRRRVGGRGSHGGRRADAKGYRGDG